jgi:hypothetical protein
MIPKQMPHTQPVSQESNLHSNCVPQTLECDIQWSHRRYCSTSCRPRSACLLHSGTGRRWQECSQGVSGPTWQDRTLARWAEVG